VIRELAELGVDADLQPHTRSGDVWVSVWAGLLVRCDGLTFTWTTRRRSSSVLHFSPADSPREVAEMIAGHYRLLVARYPAPTCPLQGLEAAMSQ
jgi:hypothetical protein